MFSPNARYCAFFEPFVLEVWECRKNHKKWSLPHTTIGGAAIFAVTNDGCVIFRDGKKYDESKCSGRYCDHWMICGGISPCGKYLAVSKQCSLAIYDVDTFELLAYREDTPVNLLFGFLDSDTYSFRLVSKVYEWKWREDVLHEKTSFDGKIVAVTPRYFIRQVDAVELNVVSNHEKKTIFKGKYTGIVPVYHIAGDYLIMAHRDEAITVRYLKTSSSVETSPLIVLRKISIACAISNDGSLVLERENSKYNIIDLMKDSFTLLFALQLVLPLPLYVILLIHDWYAFLYADPFLPLNTTPIEAIEEWQHGKKVEFLRRVQESMQRLKNGV